MQMFRPDLAPNGIKNWEILGRVAIGPFVSADQLVAKSR